MSRTPADSIMGPICVNIKTFIGKYKKDPQIPEHLHGRWTHKIILEIDNLPPKELLAAETFETKAAAQADLRAATNRIQQEFIDVMDKPTIDEMIINKSIH